MSNYNKQKQTEDYQPTMTEKKIIEGKLNPEYRNYSVVKFCDTIGIHRSSYYDAFKKPEFIEYYNKKSKDLIAEAVGPLINTFIKEALKGNYNQGLALLKMSGMYEEKSVQKIEAEVRGEITQQIKAEVRAEVEEEMRINGELKVNQEIELDLSGLSVDELNQLLELKSKVKTKGDANDEPAE